MADPVVVGIDVAAVRPCVGVALTVGRSLPVHGDADWCATESRRELLDWLAGKAPAVVAIDAPQGYSRHLLLRQKPGRTPSKSRVCDRELLRRHISVYQVPARGDVQSGDARLAAWMKTGFRYFEALKHMGFDMGLGGALPGSFGQPPALLEAYPYAAFVTLFGRLLPKKSTRDGLFLRGRILRGQGVEWTDYYDHDSLDALAAALTAARYLQGRACPIGDEREGLIWLPVTSGELKARYSSGAPDMPAAAGW